jgi:hypothetical protein
MNGSSSASLDPERQLGPEPASAGLRWHAIYAEAYDDALDTALGQIAPRLIVPKVLPLRLAQLNPGLVTACMGVARVSDVIAVEYPATRIPILQGLDEVMAEWSSLFGTIGPNGNPAAGEAPEGTIPTYPVLDLSGGQPLVRRDPSLQLLTRFGFLAVFQLSIAPSPEELFQFLPFSPKDPINVATQAVADMAAVVVASGNFPGGRPPNLDRMNPWAEAPWVIGVGATTGPDGMELANYSMVGRPGVTGPTVAADGTDELDPEGPPGTSFAGPKVCRQLLYMAAYLLTLRHAAQVLTGGFVEGVPLVGLGAVDENINEAFLTRRRLALPALPTAGIEVGALRQLWGVLGDAAIRVADLQPTPAVLRTMLTASARAMSRYQPHQVGYGFVSDETTSVYLSRFSGATLLELFVSGRIDPAVMERASALRLTDRKALPALMEIWKGAGLVVAWDYMERGGSHWLDNP